MGPKHEERDEEKDGRVAGKSSVFARTGRPGGGVGGVTAGKPRRGRGKADSERKPARPLAELKERLAKEAARRGTPRPTLRERLAAALPLAGLFGIREIGLAVALVGAVTLIWVWHQYFMWGLLVVAIGLVIMRYGESWLKGE